MPLNSMVDLYKTSRSFLQSIFATSSNNISDLNKAAETNTINMTVLFSSNVPLKKQQKITEAVAVKTKATLETVLDSYLGKNPVQTLEVMQSTLKNAVNGSPLLIAGDISSRLSEEIDGLTLTGYSLQEAPMTQKKYNSIKKSTNQKIQNALNPKDTFVSSLGDTAVKAAKGKANSLVKSAVTKGIDAAVDIGLEYAKKKLFEPKVEVEAEKAPEHFKYENYNKDNGTFTNSVRYVFDIEGINDKQEAVKTKLAITVKVNAMTIDASSLIEGLGEINSRDSFYNYLRMRAGKASFFKDVLLNIDSLKRMAKRNSSGKVEDRIIAQLISGSNVLAPDFIKDLFEFKKFTVVLSLDDADVLKSKYGLSVYKPSDLMRLFDNTSMLTLILLDLQDEDNVGVTLMDSNKPNEAYSYRMKSDSNPMNELKKLFSGVSR